MFISALPSKALLHMLGNARGEILAFTNFDDRVLLKIYAFFLGRIKESYVTFLRK